MKPSHVWSTALVLYPERTGSRQFSLSKRHRPLGIIIKMAGGMPVAAGTVVGGYLTGRALIVPLSLVISLFFLWGFSYGLLDGK